MKKGISTILAVCITVFVMLALAAGGWYIMDKQVKRDKKASDDQIASLQTQIESLEKDAIASSATPTPASTTPLSETDPNIAAVQAQAIAFEELNSEANAGAQALLAYFTPATTAIEKENYGFLMGTDAAAPRLKATATFSYSISSYSIDSVQLSGAFYIANVTENRVTNSYSSSTAQTTRAQHKIIQFVKSGDDYSIDKYYSQGVAADIASQTGGSATAQKYEGFYTN